MWKTAVEFLRRNIMIPVPQVASMGQTNELLMQRSARFAAKEQWNKKVPSRKLFTEDQAALLNLHGVRFYPVMHKTRKASRYCLL